ncbi:MAG: ABC transporter ATP-binding protein [Thermodesulfobacteriota bacterium]|nr:ABC transporter ATP-binding protein [Thermodesulfobacteriota bacterium]
MYKMLNAVSDKNILSIDDLHTHFFTSDGLVKAVDGVTLSLQKGRTLGIVGESGCGKTVLALSVMRLIPDPGRIVNGHIIFDGRDLLALDDDEMRRIKGGRISMIFQDPMTSLNPVFTIGSQISEVILLHDGDVSGSKDLALEKTIDVLGMVGIPAPEVRIKDYPHQLSGGMCQRVMIAMALACKPELMIADEPTTALDVTTQSQILTLMNDLKDKVGTSILFVTHDLGVVAETCQHVAVMYTGKIVEFSSADEIFDNPLHPYTKGLVKALPVIGDRSGPSRLYTIPGVVPPFTDLPKGCTFHDRCEESMDRCAHEFPPVCHPKPGHMVRCWRFGR